MMTTPLSSQEMEARTRLKREAAERAVEFIQSGMVVGLGTGSTSIFAVRRLARLLQDGQLRDVVGVPTSRATEAEARRLGIPITSLEVHPVVDLTIDGADEANPNVDLVKGGGGALLREKIVAQASRREPIVVDESKQSRLLGMRWAVPVEVIIFGWRSEALYLESLGARVTVRERDGTPFRTDQGNLILDCAFGPIARPAELAARLSARAAIVEHGPFIDLRPT